jgi:hypothetical protein
LVLRFFWLLIDLEVFEVIVSVEGRFGVINGVALGLLLLTLLSVLLLHEPLSSLKRFSLDVLGSLWEELAQVHQVVLADAHENDVGQLAHLLVLLGIVAQGSENDVRLQVVENLIVTEITELWQVKNGLFVLAIFAALVGVKFHNTLSDEEELLNIALVADDSLAGSIDSAVHVDNELVGEASLALIEKVVEGLFEFLEHSGILNQVSLHLWRDLLIELEFFNDQVEIIHESLFDVLSDVVVKSWLDMEWLVGLFNLLDPHVELIQFLLNQVIEVI